MPREILVIKRAEFDNSLIFSIRFRSGKYAGKKRNECLFDPFPGMRISHWHTHRDVVGESVMPGHAQLRKVVKNIQPTEYSGHCRN